MEEVGDIETIGQQLLAPKSILAVGRNLGMVFFVKTFVLPACIFIITIIINMLLYVLFDLLKEIFALLELEVHCQIIYSGISQSLDICIFFDIDYIIVYFHDYKRGLAENSISGTIPSSIANLESITHLYALDLLVYYIFTNSKTVFWETMHLQELFPHPLV